MSCINTFEISEFALMRFSFLYCFHCCNSSVEKINKHNLCFHSDSALQYSAADSYGETEQDRLYHPRLGAPWLSSRRGPGRETPRVQLHTKQVNNRPISYSIYMYSLVSPYGPAIMSLFTDRTNTVKLSQCQIYTVNRSRAEKQHKGCI